jgi:hypothetical protein
MSDLKCQIKSKPQKLEGINLELLYSFDIWNLKFGFPPSLLPLDRTGRFGADVINDPVDPLHFINNPIGNSLQ